MFAVALLLAFIENVIASSDFTNRVVFLLLTIRYTRTWVVKPLYWFAGKGGLDSWSWSQPNCPKLMQHNMKCVRHEVMFRPSEIALSESRILQTSKFYCLWIGEGASVNGYSCYRIHNTKSGKHKTSLFCYRLVLLPFASKPWWARRYTAGCCILKISDIKDFTEEKHTRKTLSGANKA